MAAVRMRSLSTLFASSSSDHGALGRPLSVLGCYPLGDDALGFISLEVL